MEQKITVKFEIDEDAMMENFANNILHVQMKEDLIKRREELKKKELSFEQLSQITFLSSWLCETINDYVNPSISRSIDYLRVHRQINHTLKEIKQIMSTIK
jgi:hypothetical protein